MVKLKVFNKDHCILSLFNRSENFPKRKHIGKKNLHFLQKIFGFFQNVISKARFPSEGKRSYTRPNWNVCSIEPADQLDEKYAQPAKRVAAATRVSVSKATSKKWLSVEEMKIFDA